MNEKYLKLVCNPVIHLENPDESYKVNDQLKSKNSFSWRIKNLKSIYKGMKGIIRIGNDNRKEKHLKEHNVSRLESGIYGIIEVVDTYKNGYIEIKIIDNFFTRDKVIDKDTCTKEIDESIFKSSYQGYLDKKIFEKVKKYTVAPKIRNIKIRDYFFLKDLTLHNLYNKNEIYIVGENGDGKTLFLQSIILALRGNEDIGVVNDFIKKTKNKMDIEIEDVHSNIYRYIKNKVKYPNIFAYGVHRSRYKGKDNKNGYLTLFDRDVSLNNLEDWFKDLRIAELENRDDVISLNTVKSMLKNILDENIEDIILEKDGIYFIEREAKVSMNELSEGYKNVIVWVSDLLSRLADNQPFAKKNSDFEGIVLVDEIDNHLHPKWSYSIVRKLRKWFPNIQFIFTTHSPSVILGASEDAVFFKIYKKNGESKISQPLDNIKNLMANSILTSPLFNLPDARAEFNDNNIDTSDDFLYSRIHKKVLEQIKNDKSITENDINNMIDKALDDLENI